MELSAIERPLRSNAAAEILGYADKYVGGEGMVSAPRELPAALKAELVDACVRAADSRSGVFGPTCAAWLASTSCPMASSLFVNEINTMPGSWARYLWVDPPVPFIDLLDAAMDEATARPSARYSAAGADGTVLRGAGAIAAKLA